MTVESAHNRQDDLKASIQETWELIREYEDKRRLSSEPKEQRRYELEIADLRKLLEGYEEELAESKKMHETEKISLAKLPSTNPELFGREEELAILDAAWANPRTNIVSLVAWGGVGKTALVNTWLGKMRHDNFRGAERVFGWTFFSQGASEAKQASADQFIASALKWFGDPEPDAGSA